LFPATGTLGLDSGGVMFVGVWVCVNIADVLGFLLDQTNAADEQ
jgi:hypothetical protein